MSQRIDMSIPTWNGKAETLEEYAIAVELLVLGTPPDARSLLGPRLVAALPSGSAHQKFALRLPRETGLDEEGLWLEPDSIAISIGPNNLIQEFRRQLGPQVVSDIGEKTDSYFYAGASRTALTRRFGQSMPQWIETEEEAYAQLARTYKLLVPDIGEILPSEVRGVLLWRNANLTPTERAVISSAIRGNWQLDNVRRQLRSTWTEPDLNARDRQSRSKGTHFAEEATYEEQTPDVTGYFGKIESVADYSYDCDDDDLAAITEHEALAAYDVEATHRTWEQARKLLNDVSKARGFYPVVGLAALPPSSRGKAKAEDEEQDQESDQADLGRRRPRQRRANTHDRPAKENQGPPEGT